MSGCLRCKGVQVFHAVEIDHADGKDGYNFRRLFLRADPPSAFWPADAHALARRGSKEQAIARILTSGARYCYTVPLGVVAVSAMPSLCGGAVGSSQLLTPHRRNLSLMWSKLQVSRSNTSFLFTLLHWRTREPNNGTCLQTAAHTLILATPSSCVAR